MSSTLALPVLYSEYEINEKMLTEFKKKGWFFEKAILKETIYKPYFFFRYHSLKAKDSKYEEVSGSALLDGTNNAFSNEKHDLSKLQELSPGAQTIKPIFSEEDIVAIAKIKIAAKENVPKSEIVIYDSKLFYIPFFIFETHYFQQLDERKKPETQNFTVNAFTGEIISEIPWRQKSEAELLIELWNELKNPSKLFSYIFNALAEIVVFFWKLFSMLFEFLSKTLFVAIRWLWKIKAIQNLVYIFVALIVIYVLIVSITH
jgi:hypothetical protein